MKELGCDLMVCVILCQLEWRSDKNGSRAQ
jgi:hypothetical protein